MIAGHVRGTSALARGTDPAPARPLQLVSREVFKGQRRIRKVVCSELRVAGEQIGLPEALAKLDQIRLGQFKLGCAMRSRTELKPDFALDICLCNWSEACPFKAD
jgi:hypothetical protein